MYKKNDNLSSTETQLPVTGTINPWNAERTIEKITVRGSEIFVSLYISELKESFGKKFVAVTTQYNKMEIVSVVSIEYDFFGRHRFLHKNLLALTNTLKNKSVTLTDTTIISFEKYKLRVDSNVLEAVQKGNEISYIVSFIVSKVFRGEKAKAIANIIQYYHETCNSYFYKNEMIVDRYHFSSVSEPLPVEDLYNLCFDAKHVLSQFCEVQAIDCLITATEVTLE